MGEIREYVCVAIPSFIMIASDWWVWEFMILISGYIGVVQQASCIIIMNIVAFAYMVAMGLEQAACTLVGMQIGKGDIIKAKQFYRSF